MDPAKPAILIIHACFLVPTHYEPLIEALYDNGFSYISCPQRATSVENQHPHPTVADDIRQVRSSIASLTNSGTAFVILAHDTGAFVANEALQSNDTIDSRSYSNGQSGGIVRIVYLSGCVFLPGKNLASALETCSAESSLQVKPSSNGHLEVENAEKTLFDGVDDKEAERLTALAVRIPSSVRSAHSSSTIWRFIPCTYVYCRSNKSIPIELQRTMVREACACGSMLDLREEELDAGFASFVTHTQDVVRILSEAGERDRDRVILADEDGIPRMGPFLTMDF
ncbi:MAG: hypothetical protein Q9159_002178 [Coniocarpon cinnabarinum]